MMKVYEEVEEARARVADLVAREKSTGLTIEEKSELDHYLQLEHIMRMAKARAQQSLSASFSESD